MLEGIDINQVKQYNESLKEYQKRAANIRAGIEYSKKELSRLCKELSDEIGVEVTEANIEQIYNERVTKINNTLKVGTEILNRIKQEEAQGAQPSAVGATYQTPVAPVMPSAPVAPQAPVMQSAPVAPQAPEEILPPPTNTAGPAGFNFDALGGVGEIPSMFGKIG